LRNLTPVDSFDIIQCCRRICNPEVAYNENQLTMAHEAMTVMQDEAASIRQIIGRAEQVITVDELQNGAKKNCE